jgi:hypothetical protein
VTKSANSFEMLWPQFGLSSEQRIAAEQAWSSSSPVRGPLLDRDKLLVHRLRDRDHVVDITELAEYRAGGSPLLRKQVNPAGRGFPHAGRTSALVPMLVHISKNPDAPCNVGLHAVAIADLVDSLRSGFPVAAALLLKDQG